MTVRGTVAASLRLLDRRDRRLMTAAVLIQIAGSLLDLTGIALIGLATTLSITAVAGQPPPPAIRELASSIGLAGLSDGRLAAVIAGLAAAVLFTKSVVSALLMSQVLAFLARREAVVAARLTAELLNQPLTFVHRRSSHQTSAALIRGTNAATVIVLSQTVIGISEMALLTVLAVPLLLINAAVAVGAIGFFGIVAFGMQRALGARSARLGAQKAHVDTDSSRTLQEALGAYREILVADRRSFYVDRLEAQRRMAAQAAGGLQLTMMLPKYVYETALVVGGFALAGVLFTTQPIANAAGTFALFLAAASRAMPSLLRLQSATLAIRAAEGPASYTYSLAEDIDEQSVTAGATADRGATPSRPQPDEHVDFVPEVSITGVSFTYPGSVSPAVRDIKLEIPAGQTIALVGRSGAGKSTLADLILGVLLPEEGEVTIGGISSDAALRRWPGAIGYVPQDVMLVENSVRANVALGLPPELIDDDSVWEALELAHLVEFVRSSAEGLDTPIGERGLRLSGGQRQRLGIARALFTRPRLLVLDESTSSLDAETEHAITGILSELGGVTMVIVAHRLSTVRHADQVVYLEDGRVVATGMFDAVCDLVPALARQAELMGLTQTPRR